MAGDSRLGKPEWLVVAAPALLLLTPFVIFLRHHAYPLFTPEIVCCLWVMSAIGGGLGALARRFPRIAPLLMACSIVWLVDVQFDVPVPVHGVGETAGLLALAVVLTAILAWAGTQAMTLVGVMAAAAFVTTLVTPADRLVVEERGVSSSVGRPGPFVLHLIVDEHIGPAGLRAAGKADAAARLRQSLEGEGFLVFDAAYAEHVYTFQSLGHILNFVTGKYVKGLVEQGRPPYRWRLVRSRYLSALADAHYAIDVYQSDHMDFCHSTVPVASCHTYASRRLGVLREAALTSTQRGSIVLGVFLARSNWIEALELYNVMRERIWPTLPDWDWVQQVKVSTIGAASALGRLEQDLRGARRGQALIAHVLLPHAPYVYDAECGMRPPSDWQSNHEWEEPPRNTLEGRAVRYTKYVGQLACTQRWIGRLLRAIPDEVSRDAIVIVHGDHGSRVTIGPTPSAPPPESDDADTFSTLFAIRSPAIRAGVDPRQSSISCLLAALVAGEFKAVPGAGECESDPVVVVERGQQRQARPLRRFEHGADGHHLPTSRPSTP